MAEEKTVEERLKKLESENRKLRARVGGLESRLDNLNEELVKAFKKIDDEIKNR